jgi:hypothetical protein
MEVCDTHFQNRNCQRKRSAPQNLPSKFQPLYGHPPDEFVNRVGKYAEGILCKHQFVSARRGKTRAEINAHDGLSTWTMPALFKSREFGKCWRPWT